LAGIAGVLILVEVNKTAVTKNRHRWKLTGDASSYRLTSTAFAFVREWSSAEIAFTASL
jgi:hypothetical protein